MATETEIVSSQTDLKQNFANGDNEVDAQDIITREKIRVWEKITRLSKDSVEVAVVLPFGTLYEPFYTDDDIDYTTTITHAPESNLAHGLTLSSTSSTTNSAGFKLYVNKTCQLKSITSKIGVTATRATLKTEIGGTILASATFSGNVATFSEPYTLLAGTYYRIECDSSGSSYTYYGVSTGTYPKNFEYINYYGGSVNGGNNNGAWNIESFTILTGTETTNYTTTAEYDSTNEYYTMYSDENGTYDILQSKTISKLHNSRLYSITPTIYAYDVNNNLVTSGFDLQIYNGNEWFSVNNGEEFILRDYNGADLDADLPAELSGYLLNYDTNNNILFQNDIKYKIHRTTEDDLIIKKIIIKLSYLQELPLVSGWATMFGTWGTL